MSALCKFVCSLCVSREHFYTTNTLFVCLQEKDLKQYMDDCGSIMSVHNVKVIHVFSTEEKSGYSFLKMS